MTTPAAPSEAEFHGLFDRTSARVYRYVRRHLPDVDCDDVVSEAYLTAWRHFHELPPDPLPWLFRAARNAMSNQRRSASRRDRLAQEIRSIDQLATADCASQAVDRTVLLKALGSLTPDDREVLLLAGWDGLDSAGIGEALGISATAARARLSRARRRLETAYQAPTRRTAEATAPLLTEGN